MAEGSTIGPLMLHAVYDRNEIFATDLIFFITRAYKKFWVPRGVSHYYTHPLSPFNKEIREAIQILLRDRDREVREKYGELAPRREDAQTTVFVNHCNQTFMNFFMKVETMESTEEDKTESTEEDKTESTEEDKTESTKEAKTKSDKKYEKGSSKEALKEDMFIIVVSLGILSVVFYENGATDAPYMAVYLISEALLHLQRATGAGMYCSFTSIASDIIREKR